MCLFADFHTAWLRDTQGPPPFIVAVTAKHLAVTSAALYRHNSQLRDRTEEVMETAVHPSVRPWPIPHRPHHALKSF